MLRSEIKEEASKCNNCPNHPCSEKCALGMVPGIFINKFLDGKVEESINYMYSVNPFVKTCGLLCPSNLCNESCVHKKLNRQLNIPKLQYEIASQVEYTFPIDKIPLNGYNVDIIGGGICGLSAVWKALTLGYTVDLYEKSDKLGGKINLIPDFRFNKTIFKEECDKFLNNDRVRIHLNTSKTVKEYMDERKTGVFANVSCRKPLKLQIKGKDYGIMYDTLLQMTRSDVLNEVKGEYSKSIVIIGGGEVAADCALYLRKQLAITTIPITLLVRKGFSDLKVSKDTLFDLYSNKIDILTGSTPLEIEKRQGEQIIYVDRTHYTKEVKNKPSYDAPIEAIYSNLIVYAIGDSITNFNYSELHNCESKGIIIQHPFDRAELVPEAINEGIKLMKKYNDLIRYEVL